MKENKFTENKLNLKGMYKSFDEEIEAFKIRTLASCHYIACDPSTNKPLSGELNFINNEVNAIADKWGESILLYFDVNGYSMGDIIINIDVLPKNLTNHSG